MAIRFKKYKNKAGHEVKALKISEKNVEELVAYINKNGGTALDETQVFRGEHLKDGLYTAVKLALVQSNTTKLGRKYRATRKAYAGDVIVRLEVFDEKLNSLVYEFARIKAADFDEYSAV